jgi:hypothetical protein
MDCNGLSENFSYDERKELKSWLKKLKRLAESKPETELENALGELMLATSQHKDEFKREWDYVKILIKKSSLSGQEEIDLIIKNVDGILDENTSSIQP